MRLAQQWTGRGRRPGCCGGRELLGHRDGLGGVVVERRACGLRAPAAAGSRRPRRAPARRRRARRAPGAARRSRRRRARPRDVRGARATRPRRAAHRRCRRHCGVPWKRASEAGAGRASWPSPRARGRRRRRARARRPDAPRSRGQPQISQPDGREVRVPGCLDRLLGAGVPVDDDRDGGDDRALALERLGGLERGAAGGGGVLEDDDALAARGPGPRPACRGRGPWAPCGRRRRRTCRPALRPGAGRRLAIGSAPIVSPPTATTSGHLGDEVGHDLADQRARRGGPG